MTLRQKARASLVLEVLVECPHCGDVINLLNDSDTNGVAHNDEDGILRDVCPTDGRHWSEACESFELEEVTCSLCKKDFDVEGVDW